MQNSLPIAFYFGFIKKEYTYDEGQDYGEQFIPFRAAPGNATEKKVTFSLILNKTSAALTFGSMLLQSTQY